MKIKKKMVVALILLAAYIAAPIFAGVFEIGDRMGPRLYPVGLHENLYSLGWKLSSHQESKPRVAPWFKSELRPWFYGMHSRNNDLVVVD